MENVIVLFEGKMEDYLIRAGILKEYLKNAEGAQNDL